jgi:hypothetical protein
VNEHIAGRQAGPALSGLIGAGRLPARLRHRRTLAVPPAPFRAEPA